MEKNETFYIGLCVCKSAELNIGTELELIWAEGQVGAIPVFSTYEAAKRYYGGYKNVTILQLGAIE